MKTQFKNSVSGEVVVTSIERNGWVVRRIYVLTENVASHNTLLHKIWQAETLGRMSQIGNTSNLDEFLLQISCEDLEDALILRGQLNQEELKWVLKNKLN